jgi:hypothetical protein
MALRVAQVVEYLPSNYKALNSNSSMAKNKRKGSTSKIKKLNCICKKKNDLI